MLAASSLYDGGGPVGSSTGKEQPGLVGAGHVYPEPSIPGAQLNP